ncbi:hypothetical protein [Shewanella gaetbuli]
MRYFNKKVILGGGVLCLVCYTYFSQNRLSYSDAEHSVDSSKPYLGEGINVKKSLTTDKISTNSTEGESEQISTPKPANLQVQVKDVSQLKKYSDDWCIADIELNEEDLRYANDQVNDWNVFQGKARIKSPNSSYAEEVGYPNNNLIISYEELPLEELRELAVNGDKWAMVAYVQNPFADNKTKDEIAKELLIIGASHYALEQLVLSSISSAKTSYRKAGEVNQETLDHIVEAVKYVYWGAQNYNFGGVGPFISNVSREPLKSNLPMELLLPLMGDKIKSSYQELASWVDIERQERGINIPDVSKAVKNEYAKNLAIRKQLSSNEIKLLSKLDITTDNVFGNSYCVTQYLANLNNQLN